MQTKANAGLEAFDIPGFCSAYLISRALLYKLWEEGKGPRFFRVGRRKLISRAAAREWQETMEALTAGRR